MAFYGSHRLFDCTSKRYAHIFVLPFSRVASGRNHYPRILKDTPAIGLPRPSETEGDGCQGSGSSGEGESSRETTPRARASSNHDTVNSSTLASTQSVLVLAYVASVYVYWLVGSSVMLILVSRGLFNVVLRVVILYAVIQIIVSVQRDVEHRVADHARGA